MTTKDNNRMEALAYIIADLKAKNMELDQSMREITEKHNDVLRQLRGMEKRKDEAPVKQTLGEMVQMRDYCDNLERENEELKRFAKAIHSFLKEKKIYMEKGMSCGFIQGHHAVCSTACLECDSCLGVIDGLGVICRQVFYGVKTGFAKR